MEADNAASKLRPDAPTFVFVPPPLVVPPPNVRTDLVSHSPLPNHIPTPFTEYPPHLVIPPPPDLQVFENIAFTPSQVRMVTPWQRQGLSRSLVGCIASLNLGWGFDPVVP